MIWGDENPWIVVTIGVPTNREKASVRQRALAEFQSQHFEEAAALFEVAASAEAAALEQIERERKVSERDERVLLRQFLDDKIRAAQALTQALKFAQAAQVLEAAAKRVDRQRYAEW